MIECARVCCDLEVSCPVQDCRSWIDYEEDLNCVNVAIDSIVGDVVSLHADLFNSNPLLQAVLLKHGKSGGGAYASGADYGASVGKKTRTLLKKMYAGEDGVPSWNGEISGLTASVAVSESYDEEE